MASFDKKKIEDALESLRNLPQTKEIRSTIKRLNIELNRLTIKKKKTPMPISKIQIRERANQRRSSFAKGAWRVAELAMRFPEVNEKFTKRQVYIDFFKRRRGEQSDISDVIWQNLSP